MTTTIRATEPRELLALIPFRLGFRPAESLVVVSVRAERSLVGLIARMDLADLAHPVAGERAASALVGHLIADGARRALAVLFTAEDLQTPGRGPARAALATLQDVAAEHLGPLEAWVVGPHGYYAVGCSDRECCPPRGRPLAELEGTRVGAQMVLDGIPVAASRDDLGWIGVVDPAARKAARRARVRWQARAVAASGSVIGAEAHRWRAAGLSLWRDLTARAADAWAVAEPAGVTDSRARCPWEPPGPAEVGRLLAALDDVLVRDAALLSCVPGAGRVADRLVAGDRGPDVGTALAAIVDPVNGQRPDISRTAAARAVLEHAAAHAPRTGHAPTLTLLALLAWWEGDGARAGVLVDRALAADPDHHMAVLLSDALAVGMPPGWVARGAG